MKYLILAILTGLLLESTGSHAQTRKHRHKHKTASTKPAKPAPKGLPNPVPNPAPPASPPGTGTPKTKVTPPGL